MKRYNKTIDFEYNSVMECMPDGEWVKYSDYAALKSKLKSMRQLKEINELRKELDEQAHRAMDAETSCEVLLEKVKMYEDYLWGALNGLLCNGNQTAENWIRSIEYILEVGEFNKKIDEMAKLKPVQPVDMAGLERIKKSLEDK